MIVSLRIFVSAPRIVVIALFFWRKPHLNEREITNGGHAGALEFSHPGHVIGLCHISPKFNAGLLLVLGPEGVQLGCVHFAHRHEIIGFVAVWVRE